LRPDRLARSTWMNKSTPCSTHNKGLDHNLIQQSLPTIAVADRKFGRARLIAAEIRHNGSVTQRNFRSIALPGNCSPVFRAMISRWRGRSGSSERHGWRRRGCGR
jgi:hypothetical protein